MIQLMWFAMCTGALLYAAVNGTLEGMLAAALEGCEQSILLTLRLGAGYLLFCGLMAIAKAAGAAGAMQRILQPLLTRLMPSVRQQETREAVALNLSLNMLGLGNAATPQGLMAVGLMSGEEAQTPGVRHDRYMLLVLNATSLQLLPTTVLTLRIAAGSAQPHAVVLPVLLCTLVSTVVGAALACWIRRRTMR